MTDMMMTITAPDGSVGTRLHMDRVATTDAGLARRLQRKFVRLSKRRMRDFAGA